MDIKPIGTGDMQYASAFAPGAEKKSVEAKKSADAPAKPEATDAAAAQRKAAEPEPPPENKAVFAVDNDKNVIIQIVDKDGNVIRQYPPEEFIALSMQLKEWSKPIYSNEV